MFTGSEVFRGTEGLTFNKSLFWRRFLYIWSMVYGHMRLQRVETFGWFVADFTVKGKAGIFMDISYVSPEGVCS